MLKNKFNVFNYQDLGFSFFPINHKSKAPKRKWANYQSVRPTDSELKAWTENNMPSNWAIVTGEISGIVVVDIDDMDQFRQSGIEFPITPTVRTSKGIHLYFKHPGFKVSNGVKHIEEWFDIRGDGGFVVAPPSLHPSGIEYEWIDGQSPEECPIAELPNWIIDNLKDNNNVSKSNSNTKQHDKKDWGQIFVSGASEGGRNDTAASLAGHYFNKGLSYEEATHLVNAWNLKNTPPLSDSELRNVLDSIYKRDLKNAKQYVMNTSYIRSFINENGEEVYEKGSFKHTILAEVIKDELPLYRNGRYFFYYDNSDGLWKQGAEDKIKLVIAEKLGIYANNSRVSETFNHVVRSTPVDQGELPFEKEHPFVINLKNGVLNLKTGEFSTEFSPQYYHHLKLPIEYNPSATSEHIEKFLSDVLYQEDIAFIHEVAASSLIKTIINPSLIFLLGSGGNGKSKLLSLMRRLVGADNTANIPLDVLQNDRFASAELHLKLLNNCGDIGDGWLPQTDVIKTITGGDPIYAQYKGKDPFKFISFATQIFSANSEPKFRDFSQGMKDRVYPVRMDKTFRGSTKENFDPLAMIDEYQLSGWLNKLVSVTQDLITRNGRFTVSEGMINKRDEWFNSMDLIGQYVEEECILEPGDSEEPLAISKKDLFDSFNRYLEDNGYRTKFTRKSFEKRLLEYGITVGKKRINGSNPIHCYVGIDLVEKLPF
ncbi:phage/plasmid primase, P4 family [Aquibacillus sediminis]|uniref:phage/plasmid primase, P4 family n=1 Tax=Aquibacillus sediminis TaxID=2574734 RepID=UPI001109C486|nr:phage/plasmid primase, P4 family [Aquibacillus sediminis]